MAQSLILLNFNKFNILKNKIIKIKIVEYQLYNIYENFS